MFCSASYKGRVYKVHANKIIAEGLGHVQQVAGLIPGCICCMSLITSLSTAALRIEGINKNNKKKTWQREDIISG